MQAQSHGNKPLAILLIALGIVFAVGAVFYVSVKTSFLASGDAHHYKHAIAAAALALACFVGANFARRAAA